MRTPALAIPPIECPPFDVPAKVQLAVHVIGDAEFLHSNRAVLFEFVCPGLSELPGVVIGVYGWLMHLEALSRFQTDGNGWGGLAVARITKKVSRVRQATQVLGDSIITLAMPVRQHRSGDGLTEGAVLDLKRSARSTGEFSL